MLENAAVILIPGCPACRVHANSTFTSDDWISMVLLDGRELSGSEELNAQSSSLAAGWGAWEA